MNTDTTTITHLTKGKLPRLPFAHYKDTVLGKKYELSIVSVGTTRARTLNRTYRDKDYATDILSFPYTKNSGEIILYIPKIRARAKEFGTTFEHFLSFLIIHGMLHLKGYDHGAIMENEEERYCKKLNITHINV